MRSAMNKDFLREIRNTRSRFLSILILVALSVAFLSGLKATAPDMKHTGDDYADSLHLADIQVLSNLGLTDGDLAALLAREEVESGEAVYVIDAYAASDNADLVAKVYSLTDCDINNVVLREGRMPQRTDECVVEEMLLDQLDIELGDSITLTPSEQMEDALRHERFKVVGTIRSPLYFSVERGTSALGAGTVKAYLYLPKDAFSLDYYTAINLRVKGAAELTAFYEEYDDSVDAVIDALEPLGDERAALRHDELVDEATEKLDDAQQKLDDAKAEADEELGKAERELADARKELDDGWQEYRDGAQELADAKIEVADAYIELQDGEQEYADGVEELRDGAEKYEDGKKKYEDGLAEYQDGLAELESARRKLEDGEAEYQEGKDAFDAFAEDYLLQASGCASADELGRALVKEGSSGEVHTRVDAALNALRAQITQLRGTVKQLDELERNEAQLDAAIGKVRESIAQLEQKEAADELAAEEEMQLAALRIQEETLLAQQGQVDAALAQIDAGLAAQGMTRQSARETLRQLEASEEDIPQDANAVKTSYQQLVSARAELDDGWEQYYDGRKELRSAEQELEDAETELADALIELRDGEQELRDARRELDDGWREYYDGLDEIADAETELADALVELRDGEQEYADGYQEYLDGKAEAEEKIADAEREIADARRKVAEIERGEWYVMSRSYNPGYTGFGQDADRMGNLASVFPVIFFLVAALVCLTTMTRMVEEQRIQIGSLKALGYSRLAISAKYIGYGLLPSVIGGVLGLLIGYTVFPKMIFTAYQIMYQVPDIELRAYPDISAFSVLAAVVCTTVSTLWACLSTLREVPASLMRPRTPKAGKRVFLEYIRPLWKRLKFIHKVTARNLFRYQKRFWMTVIGIGGCTALIIAGFGLRSSILYTMTRQYSELFHYTAQVVLSDSVLSEEREAIEEFLTTDTRVTDLARCDISSATAASDDYSVTAYVEVLQPGDLPRFMELYDCKTGETITLDDGGVYIDQKLSELLGITVGDTFLIDGDARANVTVAGIFEHYTGHFIYMTPGYYERTFGTPAETGAYLLTLESDDEELCSALFEELLSLNGVAATTRMRDTQDTYQHSMERIDFVVVIVILAAAALAVVVLYNLSNINITERLRELATIKLLGFYDGEVSAYVYRENIVLTFIGIAVGILMGHYLHTWLVLSTEIDLMMFGRETDPKSYLYAAVLTALFSFLVNLIAHFKMKKIDMVESLKSAE